MMREVIINSETYINLRKIARQYNTEMVGVLIGLIIKDEILYIFHARVTGIGKEGTVEAEARAIEAINYVLEKYPDELDAVTFHTHPSSLGAEWQDKLSGGDIENLKNEPSQRTILVSGTGAYEFRKTLTGLQRKRVVIKDLTEIDAINHLRRWEALVINEINRRWS